MKLGYAIEEWLRTSEHEARTAHARALMLLTCWMWIRPLGLQPIACRGRWLARMLLAAFSGWLFT